MITDRLHEIPPQLKDNYKTVIDSLKKDHPELGIRQLTPLDPREFGYDDKAVMHRVDFEDDTNMFIRFRRFRHPGYLTWDTTFTAEHVLLHSDRPVHPGIIAGIGDFVLPQIKHAPHFLQARLGLTDYNAVVAFSSTCLDPDSGNTPEFVGQVVAWEIQSLKNIIPSADKAMKAWADSVQK